jgi:hypothetical protein
MIHPYEVVCRALPMVHHRSPLIVRFASHPSKSIPTHLAKPCLSPQVGVAQIRRKTLPHLLPAVTNTPEGVLGRTVFWLAL